MIAEQILKLVKIGKFVQESSIASILMKPKPKVNRSVKKELEPQTPTGKAPPTPEPATPADNETTDPTFDIRRERRRTHASNKSLSVSTN